MTIDAKDVDELLAKPKLDQDELTDVVEYYKAATAEPEQTPSAEVQGRIEKMRTRFRIVSPKTQADHSSEYQADYADAGTYDFQGLILADPDHGGLMYKDVMANNGLLKSDAHAGIHVGIDGQKKEPMRDYTSFGLTSPEEVTAYSVFINVPGAMLKEMNCVITGEDMMSYADFEEYYGEGADEKAEEIWSRDYGNMMTHTFNFAPQDEDPFVRLKVRRANDLIVQYILDKQAVMDVIDYVRKVEDGLAELDSEEAINQFETA